jgi:hypothetical protein
MLAGGISETIMHFIGLLNLYEDIARDRAEYDGSSPHIHSEDYSVKHPDFQPDIAPDDIEIAAVRQPPPPPSPDLTWGRPHPQKPHPQPPEATPDPDPQSRLGPLPVTLPGGGGGGGGGHIVMTADYNPGGEQDLIDIRQINHLSNDNLIGAPALAGEAAALNAAADAVLGQMADEANSHIPHDWWMQPSNTGATEFLAAHDKAWAEGGGAPAPHSVPPGYYVDGVLQKATPNAPDLFPVAAPEAPPDLGHGNGQWADLGHNFSLNAALVVDLTQSARTMVVQGDYFKTDAIFQTNSMVDHAHFDMTGGTALPPDVGGDTMHNFADFVRHPGIYAEVPAHFAGPHWSVDVVNGNYYNVHVVSQTNYLSDNDVVAQHSSATHYEIHAGGNSLENLIKIMDGSVHYDLIVVAGAYHGMNVIFQNNVLLSDSDIRMIADGVAARQSASGGHNELANHATIDEVGGNNFHAMTPGLSGVTADLASGNTSPDPHAGLAFDGSGGIIHVLYVTGDYYDVNAVWQTNVTSDVNVMAQLAGAPPAALVAALHQDGSTTQSATVGHDTLINNAAIVDVGPTNTYVGGHVYTDAILVQANLLPDVKSQTLAGDVHTLAPELVAFVTDSQDAHHAQAAPATTAPTAHEDPMASMLH